MLFVQEGENNEFTAIGDIVLVNEWTAKMKEESKSSEYDRNTSYTNGRHMCTVVGKFIPLNDAEFAAKIMDNERISSKEMEIQAFDAYSDAQ